MIDTIIIGGGASGITASIFAKHKKNRVVVLEKNSSPLKKLLMTGNGKCNYFNEVYGTKFYHSQDMDMVDQFLSSSNIQDIKDFFDTLGIIPKIKNGYYYPFSNQASTIKNALLREANNRGVEIICNCNVLDLIKKEDCFEIRCENYTYLAKHVVIATGGCAYPKTGSDGLGYSLLTKLGHSIVKPVPALVQLVSDFPYCKDWDGIRTDCVLELFEDGVFIAKEEGEVQLTNYGISGICTFNLSHFVTRGLLEGKKEEIHLHFTPFIDDFFSIWLNQYSSRHPSFTLQELLEGFLNYKLVSVILKTISLNGNVHYQDLSNSQKLLLCSHLRSFPISITGSKSFDQAQICNGGVFLHDMNLKTMESLLVPHLYVVGELLDINGNCGGYNLTTCWISGMLAGKSIGDEND